MHTVEIVLLLLTLGALSGLAGRFVRAVPLPLIQIAIGAAVSIPQAGLHIAFDPELFLALFIPPLLFADGRRIPKREFFQLRQPILTMALALVFFTVLGVGWFVHWMIPAMPLPVAFALAAVISPTDAVAVSAITRGLGMPATLEHVLEGESLLNDASGLVALKFAVAATLTGAFSLREAGASFVVIALGGIAVGIALGWGFGLLRRELSRRLRDIGPQTTMLLLMLPFAAYILAEHFGVSGILSAVAAGMTLNVSDLERGEYVHERIQSQAAWGMIENTFNGSIFLLLGLQLPTVLGGHWMEAATGGARWKLVGYVVAISVVLLGLRWLWVTLAVRRQLWLAQLRGRPLEFEPTPRIAGIAALSGIRGAITLAGALSVPLALPDGSPFPARDLLVFLATGVILFTLAAGAIGLPLLLRDFPQVEDLQAREERMARGIAAQAALDRLEAIEAPSAPDLETPQAEAIARVATEYRRRVDAAKAAVGDEADGGISDSQRLQRTESELRLAALRAERAALYQLRMGNRINDTTLRALVQDVDLAEVALRRRMRALRRE
jgi:CPA1 family monovalent cation:H+ antiporter